MLINQDSQFPSRHNTTRKVLLRGPLCAWLCVSPPLCRAGSVCRHHPETPTGFGGAPGGKQQGAHLLCLLQVTHNMSHVTLHTPQGVLGLMRLSDQVAASWDPNQHLCSACKCRYNNSQCQRCTGTTCHWTRNCRLEPPSRRASKLHFANFTMLLADACRVQGAGVGQVWWSCVSCAAVWFT